MEKKLNKWQQFRLWLKRKYRLVILNDTTFGESFSLRLSPWGLLIGISALTIVMTTLVISLVAFTPLREYIPGYGNITERKLIVSLGNKADSLEQIVESRDEYMNNVLNVLNGKVEGKTEKISKDTTGKYKNINVNPTKSDAEFRKDYEDNMQNNSIAITNTKLKGLSDLVFFTPVKGLVIDSYNSETDHLGVDIVTKENEFAKAVLDGTIIYSGFSAKDGYVIHIQHSNNLMSIYKHNADLLKQVGTKVKAGEAISLVGNTGTASKGPHLHFELWYNGIPINPQEVIGF